MSAVATIVLPDAQATPVNHSFLPLGPDSKQVWWFEDQVAGSPAIGYNRLSLSLTRPGNPSPGQSSVERLSRVKISIHTPKLEALSNNSAGFTPSPTVAYIPRVNIEFLLPDRAIPQDRKDLLKYAVGALSSVHAVEAVQNLLAIY